MIGKVISAMLNDVAITTYLPFERIFPYVLNENTTMPAIVYKIVSLQSEYSKSGWVEDNINFSVRVYSNDYKNLQDIILAVRGIFEMKKSTSINMSLIRISGFSENYDGNNNLFYTELEFKTNINKY